MCSSFAVHRPRHPPPLAHRLVRFSGIANRVGARAATPPRWISLQALQRSFSASSLPLRSPVAHARGPAISSGLAANGMSSGAGQGSILLAGVPQSGTLGRLSSEVESNGAPTKSGGLVALALGSPVNSTEATSYVEQASGRSARHGSSAAVGAIDGAADGRSGWAWLGSWATTPPTRQVGASPTVPAHASCTTRARALPVRSLSDGIPSRAPLMPTATRSEGSGHHKLASMDKFLVAVSDAVRTSAETVERYWADAKMRKVAAADADVGPPGGSATEATTAGSSACRGGLPTSSPRDTRATFEAVARGGEGVATPNEMWSRAVRWAREAVEDARQVAGSLRDSVNSSGGFSSFMGSDGGPPWLGGQRSRGGLAGSGAGVGGGELGLQSLEELHATVRMHCFQWRRANLLFAHAFASALAARRSLERASVGVRTGDVYWAASRASGRMGRAAAAHADARDTLWLVRTARGGFAAGPRMHRAMLKATERALFALFVVVVLLGGLLVLSEVSAATPICRPTPRRAASRPTLPLLPSPHACGIVLFPTSLPASAPSSCYQATSYLTGMAAPTTRPTGAPLSPSS